MIVVFVVFIFVPVVVLYVVVVDCFLVVDVVVFVFFSWWLSVMSMMPSNSQE